MAHNLCRVCLSEEISINIFKKTGDSMISSKLMSLTKAQINPNDGLPHSICLKCVLKLEDCLQFIRLCEDTDLKLRGLLFEKINDSKLNMSDIKINLEKETYSLDYENTMSPRSDTEKVLFIDESVDSLKNNLKGQEIKLKQGKIKQEIYSAKNKTQQCFTCGKVMSSGFRLKTHLRTHTGERPYSCPHCSKNFSLAQNLKVHLRIHTGEKPLQCTVCGESFAQSAGLAAHKRKHTGQTPYQCLLCPRSFRTIGHLQYHTRRHTGEKNFECDTCGRAFITRSDLKQHLLTHSGIRPHVCCICGLRLSRSSHLKRHMQLLHKGNIFSCDHCSVKFTKKIDLERHLMKHEESTRASQSLKKT